jgi:nucleoside-diphosphate-sugar epimerase
MTVPFADSLKERSVFVTGHTGFKGSWLTLWLHRLGAKVTGYSLLPPTEPNNFEASKIKGVLAQHCEADGRNPSGRPENSGSIAYSTKSANSIIRNMQLV